MTPGEASDLLGLPVGSSVEEIDRAYRRLARVHHPDVLAGEPNADLAGAAERFARIVAARELLSGLARSGPAGASVNSAGYAVPLPPLNPIPVYLWTTMLVVAALVSFLGGALALQWFDLVLRVLPLGAAAVLYAVSGQRVLFVVVMVLLAISAAVTLAYASFGALLAFGFLVVPAVGLAVRGLAVERYREAVRA